MCTFRHGHRRIELETRVSTATSHFPLRPESRILKVGANNTTQVKTVRSVTKVESPRRLVVLLLWVFVVSPRVVSNSLMDQSEKRSKGSRWLETTGQTLEGRDLERPLRVKTSRYPLFTHWPLLMDSPSVLFMGSSTAPSHCLWRTGISKHRA